MIKIEYAEVVGWEHAIRGMRNPLNSWDKSDSLKCLAVWGCDCAMCENDHELALGCHDGKWDFCIGKNDFELMKKLAKAGTDHRKFMRMITVYVDITAPMYWWAEFDTYKIGTVRNSCSKMHKLTAKEFELDDFSHDKLNPHTTAWMNKIIDVLNVNREAYLHSKDKHDWWQIIQLLPSSYNQRSTVMLNYEVLANIYKSRHNHKLDEWVEFCEWIECLPYSEIIIDTLPKGAE